MSASERARQDQQVARAVKAREHALRETARRRAAAIRGQKFRGHALIWTRALLAASLAASVWFAVILAHGVVVHHGDAATEALVQAESLQQAIQTVYSGQGSYEGVSAEGLIAANQAPTSMVSGNTLTHAYGGRVRVYAVEDGFTMAFDDLSSTACVNLATSNQSDMAARVALIDAKGEKHQQQGMFDLDGATVACALAPNSVSWTFH